MKEKSPFRLRAIKNSSKTRLISNLTSVVYFPSRLTSEVNMSHALEVWFSPADSSSRYKST